MIRIVWSPQALLDVESIRDYISHDSPRYAELVVRRLVSAVERLEAFPQSGRIVPEKNREDLREVIAMSHPTGPDVNDDMLPEYDFSKGVRGKHHQAYKAGTNVVFLDPDVAAAFGDSTSVNQALRLLLKLAKESVAAGRPSKRMQRTSQAQATKPRRRSR